MQQYIFSIQSAFLAFPFLAALFTVPFLLVQYHRYGSVPMLRAMVVYSFILYMLCSYFLVILPLPEIADVAKRTDPYINWYPYKGILSFWKHTQLDPFSLESWKIFYRTTIWREPALNLLMTIPFGIYLRYYFRRRWWQSVGLGFLLSLFFELTQLTGLYGIYPRPYRLFDITDLINNTTGTLIGFWIAPLFVFFLPSKQKLEQIAYKRGRKISVLRYAMAFLVDWAFVGIGLIASLSIGWLAPFWLSGPLYFACMPAITGGFTIGSYLCSFRIVNVQKKPPKWWRCFLRAGILYLPFSSMVSLWILLEKIQGKVPYLVLYSLNQFTNIIEFICLVAFVTLLLQSIVKFIFKEKRYYYEQLSGTYTISTIPVPKVPEYSFAGNVPSEPEDSQDWIYHVKNES